LKTQLASGDERVTGGAQIAALQISQAATLDQPLRSMDDRGEMHRLLPTLWLPRRRTASCALAVQSSLLLHLLAAGAVLAAPFLLPELPLDSEAKLQGRRGVIVLQAALEAPQPEMPVVEIPQADVPVVVTPHEARIEARRYAETSSADVAQSIQQAADVEVPQEIAAEVPAAATRAGAQPPSETPPFPQPLAQLPRQQKDSPPPAAAVHVPPLATGFDNISRPLFAGNAPPEYPALAQQNGWHGTVVLRLRIDADGRVTDVRILTSSGYEILDAAAVNAVRRWRGEPARRNGKPIATEETQPVVFRPRL
jgi:protein TonB